MLSLKVRVSEICKTSSGGTPLKSKREFYDEGGIPWLLSGEVANKNITTTRKFITQAGLDGSSAKIFPVNTVVIAMYGATAGEVGILRCEAATNQAVCGIFPDERIIPEFLYYFFLNHKQDLIAQAVGNAQPNISQQKIKNTSLNLPPINEQKCIVAILELAFAEIERARANAQQNLNNARELFGSYLQQVFSQRGDGWVEERMSDVCEINSILIDPKDEKHLDLLHIGAGNMISKTGELIVLKTAREERLISGKFIFDSSMVLYSKIRPYLMKVCRPNFTGLCSADIYPLSPKTGKLDKGYLFYLLLSRDFTDYAISGSGRAGMPKVNRTHLFNYDVAVPSIERQQKFVIELDLIALQSQKLEKLYLSKLSKLEELKKSILQKAFSGELSKAVAA